MKVVTVRRVLHTGLLEGRPADSVSYEGPLLSCAHNHACAEAWQDIAKLGMGPVLSLSFPDKRPLRLLDFHALTDEQKSQMAADLVSQGLAERCSLFRGYCEFDEESEQERYFVFETREAAEAEVDASEYEKARIEEVADFRPGPEIRAWWSRSSLDPAQWREALVLFAASKIADLDGIFWDDEFDPAGLSAPRVGIFPHVVPTLVVK